jgi:ribonuclease P protein component
MSGVLSDAATAKCRLMRRALRLRRPEQFVRVRREGRTWETPMLALNAAPSRRRGTRCGFVVGKRIGKATERNRARRRVREAVRLSYPQIAPHWDLVFIARSPLLITTSFGHIRTTIESLLRRAGAWREPLPPTPDPE